MPLLVLFLLLMLPLAGWGEAVPQATPYNPKPLPGDLVLPMPDLNGAPVELVFRRVAVPGKGLWGDREQLVQLGDAGGGVFEGVQRTLIGGSFVDEAQQWHILVAKYELTKGQYAAVMGFDGLTAVSGDPADGKLDTLQGRALREALSMPLSWVGPAAVQAFIHRYNRWLFDPAGPERSANLPRLGEAPGFVRLIGEEEWEFCARGGLPAIEEGVFERRLPFPVTRLNNAAWHLGNARNRVRPVGLREPNGLGIHDLYGNVQEMAGGRFRAELIQGRRGGIPVRGAGVSTPPNEVRASSRAELDAWGWDRDQGTMVERRSFNIGVRLAIGSNLVTDSRMRKALEAEYAAYRDSVRAATPAGRSLDNLVGQASAQIGTLEPIIARLAARYPDDREALLGVQQQLDNARARLDQAQRDSARSLLQDAARNGVNLSVAITKGVQLGAALESAHKLLALSTRYQSQVDAVNRSLAENAAAAAEQFGAYEGKIRQLGEFDAGYLDPAFAALAERGLSAREQAVLEIARIHLDHFIQQRVSDPDAWRAEFDARFSVFDDPRGSGGKP